MLDNIEYAVRVYVPCDLNSADVCHWKRQANQFDCDATCVDVTLALVEKKVYALFTWVIELVPEAIVPVAHACKEASEQVVQKGKE